MNEHPKGGISRVDPLRAIDLIWTLRDIKAKRTLLPIDPDHLRELIELDLVEMRDKTPTLTNNGHNILDYIPPRRTALLAFRGSRFVAGPGRNTRIGRRSHFDGS